MVLIPAFCDNCGAAFSSGIAVENCSNITLSGNRSGPCPRCGGMGSVIDGVFNVVGDVVEVLSAPQSTIESLNKLTQLLKKAAQEKETPEEISNNINEDIPELSEITRFLPKNATELVAWLTFILLATQIIIQLGKEENPNTQIIINQSIEQSMQQNNFYPFKQLAVPQSRNSLCNCGSGKRYKHCCGKI